MPQREFYRDSVKSIPFRPSRRRRVLNDQLDVIALAPAVYAQISGNMQRALGRGKQHVAQFLARRAERDSRQSFASGAGQYAPYMAIADDSRTDDARRSDDHARLCVARAERPHLGKFFDQLQRRALNRECAIDAEACRLARRRHGWREAFQ